MGNSGDTILPAPEVESVKDGSTIHQVLDELFTRTGMVIGNKSTLRVHPAGSVLVLTGDTIRPERRVGLAEVGSTTRRVLVGPFSEGKPISLMGWLG